MNDQNEPSPQDSFLLFMVFAVASVRTFRKGISNSEPYGYFLAAQKYVTRIPLVGSLEGVQNLLLIIRFGMYHDIGTIPNSLTCGRRTYNDRHIAMGTLTNLYSTMR